MGFIGFDIGNESCVIATVRRHEVEALLNDESKSKTPVVVSFGPNQRFLGSAAAAFVTANPKSTVSQIKRLIGKLYKEVEEDLKLLPFVTSEGPRGGILIELEYLKQKWSFTPVEILAMLFKHLKQLTEKNLKTNVFDCVIGIPSYFSDLQRRMYLDAARLAGLNPLRLMHDGTAIALCYGMYKTDVSDSRPTYVMFVDIGHCDTQVTVASFSHGKMEILSHSFDQNLGGRDFDEVLFRHFATQFNENFKIDVYQDERASVRLRAECEIVKKVLSASAEASLSIDCLIGDTDVRGIITRQEFENLSSKLLERVIEPCKKALLNSGLSKFKIHTIELVGSGSRIPAITKVLASFLKKEPRRTLNASECVARGCALRCAMLSPFYTIRDYKVEDIFPYSIVIRTPQEEIKVDDSTVIPSQKKDIMPFTKGIPFPKENTFCYSEKIPFNIQLAYRKESDFPIGISDIIGHFNISSDEHSNIEKAKVEIKIRLNENGIVKLPSAAILEDIHVFIQGLKKVPSTHNLNLSITENQDVSTTIDELNVAKEKEKMLTEQEEKMLTEQDISLQEKLLEPVENSYKEENAIVKETKASQADHEILKNAISDINHRVQSLHR